MQHHLPAPDTPPFVAQWHLICRHQIGGAPQEYAEAASPMLAKLLSAALCAAHKAFVRQPLGEYSATGTAVLRGQTVVARATNTASAWRIAQVLNSSQGEIHAAH